jgi:hypothetical protein
MPTEYWDTHVQDGYFREAIKCFEQAIAISGKMGDERMKKGFEANLTEVRSLVASQSNRNNVNPAADIFSIRNRGR